MPNSPRNENQRNRNGNFSLFKSYFCQDTSNQLVNMKLKEIHPKNLTNRHDRACAKLARIARANTYFGGASAIVVAKRLKAMGSDVPGDEIVSDIYSKSNLDLGEWGAFECPECGNAVLGKTNAINCCQEFHETIFE